eukprot:gene11651-12712_t
MSHISIVDLTDLPSLNSLKGLGKENRVIAINNINNSKPVDDIHLLQNCKIVHIYNDLLKDSTGFVQVEELLVQGSSVGMKPDNITDLITNDIPDSDFFGSLGRCKFVGVQVGEIAASEVRHLFEQVLTCSLIVKFSLSSAGIRTSTEEWEALIVEQYNSFESFRLSFFLESSVLGQIVFLRNIF